MAFLTVLGIVIVWIAIDIVETNKPQAPGVRDWNAYNKAAVGMSARDIKKGLQQGRW